MHASCYGETRVVNEEWKCVRCSEAESPEMIDCRFCCMRGGAFHPIIDGGWAHLLCTLYNPNAKFLDPTTKRPISAPQTDEKITKNDEGKHLYLFI